MDARYEAQTPGPSGGGHAGSRARVFLIRGALQKLFAVIYLIIGFVVASSHKYLAHPDAAKPLLSAALAVALWPLVLFGVNVHIK